MKALYRESVRVVSIDSHDAGDELVGHHASGVSELLVDDAYDFSEDGGQLVIDGDVLSYSRTDDDADKIILTGPTAAAYDDGAQVKVWPVTPTKTAQVTNGIGSSIPARVFHALDGFLPEGIRAPEAQESGVIFFTRSDTGDYDDVELVDVAGKKPALDPDLVPTDAGDDDDSTDPYPDFPTAELDLTSPDAFMVYTDGSTPYEFLAAQPAPGTYGLIRYFTGTDADYAAHSDFTGDVPGEVWPIWYIPVTGPLGPGLDVGVQVAGEGWTPELLGAVTTGLGARSGGPTDFGSDADAVRYPTRYFNQHDLPFSDAGGGLAWDGAGWKPDFSIVPVDSLGSVFIWLDAFDGGPGIGTQHLRHIRAVIEEKP